DLLQVARTAALVVVRGLGQLELGQARSLANSCYGSDIQLRNARIPILSNSQYRVTGDGSLVDFERQRETLQLGRLIAVAHVKGLHAIIADGEQPVLVQEPAARLPI